MSNNIVNTDELAFMLNSQQGQRSPEWFEKRKGRFTGSKIKDLMKCTASSKKYEWGRPEKIIDFSDTAIKYIYSKAKEIQRNKVVKTQSSASMKYGTNNESVVKELLKKQYPNAVFSDCDFIEFIPNIAGASPDGLVNWDSGEVTGLEIKCATDWGGEFDRVEEDVDQSHGDFWQLQAEMLALKVKKLMYVIAEPSEDIFEPNITDLEILFVDASPIHQQAIIHRCMIGAKAISYFLTGIKIKKSIVKACTEYEFTD